jgi:hypothetical protein
MASILMVFATCLVIADIGGAQERSGGDTLVVAAPSVIFYACTEAEYDSLITHMTFALDSLATSSERTCERISPFLKKIGIAPVRTTASYFRFVPPDTTLQRRRYTDLYGIIVYAPGQPPERIPKGSTDVDVLTRVHTYFRPK